MIFETARAGDTVETEREHPLLQAVRGLTLIDDAVDLDVARTEERLAVGDGQLVKRLTMLNTPGRTARHVAGIDLVENTFGIDRIVFQRSIGRGEQLLVFVGLSGAYPMAVGDLGITLGTQRMVVDIRLVFIVFQLARGRTVVYQTSFLSHVAGNGGNLALFLGFLSRYYRFVRDTATEVTVADGAVVGQGDTATVDLGLHVAYDTQPLEQCAT